MQGSSPAVPRVEMAFVYDLKIKIKVRQPMRIKMCTQMQLIDSR